MEAMEGGPRPFCGARWTSTAAASGGGGSKVRPPGCLLPYQQRRSIWEQLRRQLWWKAGTASSGASRVDEKRCCNRWQTCAGVKEFRHVRALQLLAVDEEHHPSKTYQLTLDQLFKDLSTQCKVLTLICECL